MAAALNAMVSKMVRQAFWRRGFSEPALVTQWPSIVGAELARRTVPLKVVFPRKERTRGTLHIKVDGPFAVELQHIAPLVIERLNAYYGYAALQGLALHQAPVEAHPGRQEDGTPADGAGPDRAPPQASIVEIEDRGLRAALRRLERTIRADSDARPGR